MATLAKSDTARFWIRVWLVLISVMVYAMILIGGATRLTDSGLSITEWQPISGALPPLSEADWMSEFAKYQGTAEFQAQNYNMTLAEFQYIYWWEWGHRLFGRLIGLVAIAGVALFAAKRWLSGGLAWRLGLLVGLGGLQGAVGWWMVSSGVGETTRIDVAPYRLMTHFMLAMVIIGYAFWLFMSLSKDKKLLNRRRHPAVKWAVALLVLIGLQLATGALVAGLDAGRSYTDWPLMAGEVFPSGYVHPDLGVRSLFEGREATQFNHRMLAYIILVVSVVASVVWFNTRVKMPFLVLTGVLFAQAGWGILTLVNAAPMDLALVHQGMGVIVFLCSVWLVFTATCRGESRLGSL